MNYIDLNCDMGESFGAYKIGNDESLMDYISSANIACGYHAGDPSVMNRIAKLAIEKEVAIGAHVGFQDLVGFGRRKINLCPREVFEITLYQIGALNGFVNAYGGKMNHVKPHGALYNMAAEDCEIAKAIAEAIYKTNPSLILYGLSGSHLISEAEKIGLNTASEVFGDRTYTNEGKLTRRKFSNAIIEDEKEVIKNVMNIVSKGVIISTEGKKIYVKAETICLHGDTPNALKFAKGINRELKKYGAVVCNKSV